MTKSKRYLNDEGESVFVNSQGDVITKGLTAPQGEIAEDILDIEGKLSLLMNMVRGMTIAFKSVEEKFYNAMIDDEDTDAKDVMAGVLANLEFTPTLIGHFADELAALVRHEIKHSENTVRAWSASIAAE